MTFVIPAGTSVFVRKAGDNHWYPRKHTTKQELKFTEIARGDCWYWEFKNGDWEVRVHRDEVQTDGRG